MREEYETFVTAAAVVTLTVINDRGKQAPVHPSKREGDQSTRNNKSWTQIGSISNMSEVSPFIDTPCITRYYTVPSAPEALHKSHLGTHALHGRAAARGRTASRGPGWREREGGRQLRLACMRDNASAT